MAELSWDPSHLLRPPLQLLNVEKKQWNRWILCVLVVVIALALYVYNSATFTKWSKTGFPNFHLQHSLLFFSVSC
jgi:hypothetical protein